MGPTSSEMGDTLGDAVRELMMESMASRRQLKEQLAGIDRRLDDSGLEMPQVTAIAEHDQMLCLTTLWA